MSKKATDIVAYIGILGWLIAFLAGDKENSKFHLNQALVLDIAALVCSFLAGIPVVGFVIALVSIVIFVFCIMGLVSAVKGEEKPLPFIGNIQLLK